MRRPREFLLVTSIVALVLLESTVEARFEDGRYYAPNGEFSIDKLNPNFLEPREQQSGNTVIVDFVYGWSVNTTRVSWTLTLEWILLPQAIPKEQFEGYATQIVKEYGAARLEPGNTLAVQDWKLDLNADPPAYSFVSQGRMDNVRADWDGIVMLFGDRIAFVSSLGLADYADRSNTPHTVDTMAKHFATWAHSLRRETVPAAASGHTP